MRAAARTSDGGAGGALGGSGDPARGDLPVGVDRSLWQALARRPELAECVLQVALPKISRYYRQESWREASQTSSVNGVYDQGADGTLRFF